VQGELNIQTMGFQSWGEFVSCCHPLLQPLLSVNEGNISCSAWCSGAPGQSDEFVLFLRIRDADVNSDFQFLSPSSSVATILAGSAVTVKKKRKSADSLASSEAGQQARRHSSDPLSNSEKSKQLPQNAGGASTLLPLVGSFHQEQEFYTMRRATQTIPTSTPCAKRVTQFVTSSSSSRS